MSTFYTSEEIAAKLKLNVNTIWRYLKSGKLPSSKIGNRYRISEEQLQQFLFTMSAIAIRVRQDSLKAGLFEQNEKPWAELSHEEREARLTAVRGKYADRGRSLDDFLRQKHEEVEEEERRWEEHHRNEPGS